MNTPEQQLSESLLAACKAAGIEEPRYIAQDKDGEVWSFDLKPSKKQTTWDGDKAQKIDHPPYADEWQDSLLEWVEPQEMLPNVFIPHEGEPLTDVLASHLDHVADTSKKVDDAIRIAYQNHLRKGDGICWSRANDYRQGWQDALAWRDNS
jgi:hypothetical protein